MFVSCPEEPVTVIIDDVEYKMMPKVFKSKSVGWYLGGKIMVQHMRVQLSMSAVIVGSKPPADLIDVASVDEIPSTKPLARAAEPEPGLFEKPTRKSRKSKKLS